MGPIRSYPHRKCVNVASDLKHSPQYAAENFLSGLVEFEDAARLQIECQYKDGRLVGAGLCGSGYINDEVFGVHGIGSGVLALRAKYGKRPSGSSFTLNERLKMAALVEACRCRQ